MLLFELFGKPVQWQESASGLYKFTLPEPDGRTFVVHFELREEEADNVWELSFRDANDPRGNAQSFEKTNKGNELAIFSTVLDIVRDFIAKSPEEVVMFSAEEPNRQTLYYRMISRYVKPPMAFEIDGQDFYIGHQDVIDNLEIY